VSGSPSGLILETRDLSKSFRGFAAVSQVNLKVRQGDIHVLIGPNGAGKTTCFNLLTRFLEPSSGEIYFRGQDITHERPAALARQGMVRSFQISAVFPHLSVLENVRLALQQEAGNSFHFWASGRSLDAYNEQAMEILELVDLAAFHRRQAVELPYGRKRALEIATTLAAQPELMLLDEPTQGMGHEDVEQVMNLIQRVAQGRTILMVEHNMKVVAGISSRITVLSRGSILAEGTYAEVSQNSEVMSAYLGTEISPQESVS
jgi:branched-chain amino acid transport system ATP-binding protein